MITWTQGVADTVLATALAGDLPPLTGQALKFFRVNAAEDGGEFRTSAEVLADIGAADATLAAPLASPTFTGVPAAPTATAGTDTTQVATTAFVQAATTGADYTSAEIAVPADSGTITPLVHGLGAAPSTVTVDLICKVAELGYSVGDIVNVSYMTNDNNTTVLGVGVKWTATNISAIIATDGTAVIDFSTGGGVEITKTSWRLVFRAWL